MGRFKGVKGTILLIIMVLLIVSYYFYLSNKTETKEEDTKITPVQSILLENLEIQYPPSPKEVLKYYCEITKCLYSGTCSEEEVEKLAVKIREIYDDDLLKKNSEEQNLERLKVDIQSFQEKDCAISSYTVSPSIDVEYFKAEGYEFAKLYCAFTLRQGANLRYTTEKFLLRKDEDGHWKIYGWELAAMNEDE